MKLPKSRRTIILKSYPWTGVEVHFYWSLGMWVCDAFSDGEVIPKWAVTVVADERRLLPRKLRLALYEKTDPRLKRVSQRIRRDIQLYGSETGRFS